MDIMNIASLSTAMSASQTMGQIGTSVMSMALDDFQQTGAQTAAMLNSMPAAAMEASVNPSVGGNIDVSV